MPPRGKIKDNVSGPIETGLFFTVFGEVFGESEWISSDKLKPPFLEDEFLQSATSEVEVEDRCSGVCPVHPDRMDIQRVETATVSVRTPTLKETWSEKVSTHLASSETATMDIFT